MGGSNNTQGTEPWPIPEIKDSGYVQPSPSPSIKPSAKPSPSPSIKPSAKPSPSPSIKPSAKPSPSPSVKPSSTPADGTSNVKVTLSNQTSAVSNTIGGSISLNVTDDKALDLSKVKVKYYFSADSNSNQTVWIDSAAMQYSRAPWYAALTDGTSAAVKAVNTGSSMADRCMEVGFSTTDKLEQGATLTINFRLANDNWSTFNQTNDYSYGKAENIVVTYDGKVVSGNDIK
jgi:hypothetical protein